jgi:hypothetical protein
MNDEEKEKPKIFYVYQFVEPGAGVPMYIGKGYSNRMYQHLCKSKLTKELPFYQKLRSMLLEGVIPEITKVEENLTEEEALILEEKLIRKYGYIGVGNGSLYNLKTTQVKNKESKLNYIPTKNEDLNIIIKRAAGYLKRINIMTYNKQQMVRMVNNHAEIQEIYLHYCGDGGLEIDEALKKVYKENVEFSDDPEIVELWNSLADSNYSIPILPKIEPLSQVACEVKRLSNLYGWKQLMLGMIEYAEKQEVLMHHMGLVERAEQWHGIKVKLGGVRKNVMD